MPKGLKNTIITEELTNEKSRKGADGKPILEIKGGVRGDVDLGCLDFSENVFYSSANQCISLLIAEKSEKAEICQAATPLGAWTDRGMKKAKNANPKAHSLRKIDGKGENSKTCPAGTLSIKNFDESPMDCHNGHRDVNGLGATRHPLRMNQKGGLGVGRQQTMHEPGISAIRCHHCG